MCKYHLHFYKIFMATPRNPTRQRLVNAALELFAQQGITETTTKQIAEQAEVNEVTLFRQFGNKQGLILAVMEEAEIFDQLAASLGEQIDRTRPPAQTITRYAQSYLSLLDAVPEMLRSIIGEGGKYPIENREALGRGINRAHQSAVDYLGAISLQEGCANGAPLNNDRLVSMINSTLLGYAVLESATEFHGLWTSRESFIDSLVQLVLSQPLESSPAVLIQIADLPATLVHNIFQRAQKKGSRELALVYLLFGAGVSPVEVAGLERVHYLSDRDAQFVQITQGAVRQVPVNQWIMGKRYGSYQKNPLTQWLKGRKDSLGALLLGLNQESITIMEIQEIWRELTIDLLGLDGQIVSIEQAQQTWCVEMLLRGISLVDMQILTGLSIEQLAPYGQRAKAKAVLEQGLSLDKPK
jgi:AcrR family transcriptional regulator